MPIRNAFETFIKNCYSFIYTAARKRVEGNEVQILNFGIFGIINYPVFYLVWSYAAPQNYESLIFRLTATLLCFLLIIKNFWPPCLRKYLPIYWYVTLIFCLPFFVTYMLLQNQGSTIWVTNVMLVLMLLTLLADWISLTIMSILGISLAILIYKLTSTKPIILNDYVGTISTYASAIIIAGLFSRTREKLGNAKLQAMISVGSSIAHELRTPLNSINGGIKGIKKYLPKFIETYELAKKSNLEIPIIRQDHYEKLSNILDEMESETYSANTIIDMLLVKVQQNNIKSLDISNHSILDCIDEALRRYPFNTNDHIKKIHWNMKQDFIFMGQKLLVIHILFNLIKNSLYFIENSQKGEIYIWTKVGEKFNSLHFKDTANGIPKHIKIRLFEKFFTATRNGTGLGLAFCKMVMDSLGGDIICNTQEGKFTEFILNFQKFKMNSDIVN